jgi:ABC-2 type transport system permease protein
MHKFWLVAKQEYQNRTFQRSFIIGTLIVPIMLAVVIGVTVLIIENQMDDRPFGYVDFSGTLSNATMPQNDKETVEIIAFSDIESAKNALYAEEIQGYHVLPKNYLDTLYVDLYYLEDAPASRILRDFDDYVRANILLSTPTAGQLRLMEGTQLTVRSINGSRQFQDNQGGIISIILPFALAMFFLFAIMGASGYFLQVVTDEKENRTMEIMVTSISPIQLIGGKSIALVAVGLTQLGVWVASIALAWIFAKNFFEGLQGAQLPWDILILLAIFFIPSYAIVAGLMICIGSIVSELQEGQQISGIFNLLFTFPVFFAALVFADPNSPLMVFLSFWPTTALITMIMRWGLTIIPWWQILLSWTICTITAVAIIWFATRLFRYGMLRYGQRITLKAALKALAPNQ